jgi:hypothetical protein
LLCVLIFSKTSCSLISLFLATSFSTLVNADAGVPGQDDNPFNFGDVFVDVQKNLSEKGFTYGEEYFIIKVPNIVDISYGRGVGYTFTEHDLGKEVHDISATKIRAKLREEGKLAAKY